MLGGLANVRGQNPRMRARDFSTSGIYKNGCGWQVAGWKGRLCRSLLCGNFVDGVVEGAVVDFVAVLVFQGGQFDFVEAAGFEVGEGE